MSAGSCSVSDIPNYFKCIIKKHETLKYNPPIWVSINIIENRITFKIKTGYHIELLSSKMMKLLGSTKRRFIKTKIGNMFAELVLVYWNLVNNTYQYDSRILYTFTEIKSFGSLVGYFTVKIYLFENIQLRFFTYSCMVYWSKF